MRNINSGAIDRTNQVGDRLDRELDGAVRRLMTQSPAPHVYSAVAQAIRSLPQAPQPGRVPIMIACAAATVVLLAAAAFEALGPRALQIDSAIPGRGILLLTWISNTDLARWIGESDFAYPGILFLHTFGLATVVGFSVAIDVRLLGIAPRIPAISLRRLFPYIWFGFAVNGLSGLLLFIADTSKALNPLFALKLALVALGVISMTLIDRELFRTESASGAEYEGSRRSKIIAVASLIIWIAAIAAGRMVAYVHGQ